MIRHKVKLHPELDEVDAMESVTSAKHTDSDDDSDEGNDVSAKTSSDEGSDEETNNDSENEEDEDKSEYDIWTYLKNKAYQHVDDKYIETREALVNGGITEQKAKRQALRTVLPDMREAIYNY